MNKASFRFYEELNDFLPNEKRKQDFDFTFQNNPSIKDAIESLGVPHTEIDLILINGKSVNFSYQLQNKDKVSVYPIFEALDISNVTHLRPAPLRESKFILDVHLGKLARNLRLIGFDVIYQNHMDDEEIIEIAVREQRIVLTRDLGILKNNKVTHGYFLRATDPFLQTEEIINYFDLKSQAKPFTRCIDCNGLLIQVDKAQIIDKLPEKTKDYYEYFNQCQTCDKVYWEGSHFAKMHKFLKRLNIEWSNE